jgi:hypothetical protein
MLRPKTRSVEHAGNILCRAADHADSQTRRPMPVPLMIEWFIAVLTGGSFVPARVTMTGMKI